jgi:predicted transposase YdaD
MPISPTPHNDFFYQVMSRKDKAKTFFERYLPKAVQEITNLEAITLAESKHVSDAGISLYNDVLYRCEFNEGQPGYLFAMCEHQSTPESQMPLRLLEYNTMTIRQHLKQGQEQFPIIINSVVYHGSKPWNYSTAFADYYANPTLGKEFLDMAPFTLINIPALPVSTIRQDEELGFCFEAFRCTSHTDPYEAFQEAVMDPIFKVYFDALSKELRNLVLSYLGNCIDRNKHSLEDLINLVSSNPQEKEEIMTSIAQAIRQEGMQEGMQQGEHKKALHIAKNMLSSNEPKEKIHQFTGLSWVEIEALLRKQETTKKEH